MLYMWLRYGKPDASMTGNGLLAGLVAITAPSGFVNPVGSVLIGVIAGVLVCISVEFVDRVLKVDDPVGAISVHGANGLWGPSASQRTSGTPRFASRDKEAAPRGDSRCVF